MSRPQRWSHDCTACDGSGLTRSEDWDEHGPRTVTVRCEVCDGIGRVSDCRICDEPAALSVLEMCNGMCGSCAAAKELAS